jgi:UPF0755 protein
MGVRYLRQLVIGLVLISIFSVIIFCGYFLYIPIVKNDLHYILNADVNACTFANDLAQKTNLKYPALFCRLIRIRGDDKRLQSGEYLFPCGSTASQILTQIVQGKVVHHTFTIIDGWNFKRIFTALEDAPAVKYTLIGESPEQVAQAMQLKYKTPEGLLFPETYDYTYGTTDLQILNRAYNMMQQHLQRQWSERSKNLPFKKQYTALIIASMVEKETGVNQEKPMIAAVILNRLKKWMHLQVDAAVIYGLGVTYQGKLTRKLLRLQTPYNTYIHYGLPPTPIAMPGKAAINAALHPAKTDMLYYVAKDNGSHAFSKTLAEHNKNVAKYQLGE